MSGYNRGGEPDIIDMRRSGIDKKDWAAVMSGKKVPTDWKRTKKVIPASYAKAPEAIRPLHKFEWNNNTPEAISNWSLRFGHTVVTSDDGYWPEGVPPDSKDNFIRGDLIFMKVSVEDFLARRRDEVTRANIGRKVMTEQYQNLCKHVGADVDEDELNEALGF